MQNFVDDAVQVYRDMQRSMSVRWQHFLQRAEVKAARDKVTEVTERVGGVKKLNQIKESVAELSGQVADTWEKVSSCIVHQGTFVYERSFGLSD